MQTAYNHEPKTAAGEAFSRPLAELFGAGAAGWLERDVPAATTFDFEDGLVSSPIGRFGRVAGTTRWARLA